MTSMPSMFKPSNVKVVAEKRPVSTLLIGLFIITQVYQLSSLAISDGIKHPGYVTFKAVITIIGILIWLDGLKSGDLGGTVLKYIGFLLLASLFQTVTWLYSYTERVDSSSSTFSTPRV